MFSNDPLPWQFFIFTFLLTWKRFFLILIFYFSLYSLTSPYKFPSKFLNYYFSYFIIFSTSPLRHILNFFTINWTFDLLVFIFSEYPTFRLSGFQIDSFDARLSLIWYLLDFCPYFDLTFTIIKQQHLKIKDFKQTYLTCPVEATSKLTINRHPCTITTSVMLGCISMLNFIIAWHVVWFIVWTFLDHDTLLVKCRGKSWINLSWQFT